MLTALALSAVAFTSTAVAGLIPSTTSEEPDVYTSTSAAAVYAAQATAKVSSPTSNVPGAAFDRIAIIWMENTDYVKAAADPNLAYLASQGQILSQYCGVTHPSEPNYAASLAGDNFGMDNDDFNQIAGNVSTVIDLLEARGISWGTYQEDMPYAGYEGYSFVNQKTGANDYVRKHNPPVLYNANTTPQRLSQMKNFTTFYEDLENDTLPQWMFITPNMTSDGHDTSVTVAGEFMRGFVEPLLTNPNFMKNTLILITFDETETYTIRNNVFTILLGDALPSDLVGTTDDMYYNHYSGIATVESNWGLDSLGRWDVGANVFQAVADKTGYVNTAWPAATGPDATRYFNQSFAGPFNSVKSDLGYPVPNSALIKGTKIVLPAVTLEWAEAELKEKSYYNAGVEIPDGLNPPAGWAN